MTLVDQIRKARVRYMTEEYDGHGEVSGFLEFNHRDYAQFRSEVDFDRLSLGTGGEIDKFEGIELLSVKDIPCSKVEFMFSNNQYPYRYALATAKHYVLESEL